MRAKPVLVVLLALRPCSSALGDQTPITEDSLALTISPTKATFDDGEPVLVRFLVTTTVPGDHVVYIGPTHEEFSISIRHLDGSIVEKTIDNGTLLHADRHPRPMNHTMTDQIVPISMWGYQLGKGDYLMDAVELAAESSTNLDDPGVKSNTITLHIK